MCLQFWMSGHLVFLNSPRLVNMAGQGQNTFVTVDNQKQVYRNGESSFADQRSSAQGPPVQTRALRLSKLNASRPPPTSTLSLMATKRNNNQRARAGSIKEQLERIEFVFAHLFHRFSNEKCSHFTLELIQLIILPDPSKLKRTANFRSRERLRD